MTGPIAGKLGVIKIGVTAIGKVRNIRVNLAVKAIKDYSMDNVNPEVLHPGEESYTFSCEKLWVDKTYAKAVLSQTGTGVSIVIYPEGGSTRYYTLANAKFTRWQLTEDKDGVAAESLEGEGKTLTITTP